MSTSVLPVSNVINVTVANTPSGLTTPNVNALALFTNEKPNNSNVYGVYLDATSVATDFGSNSTTAAMANAIFSQAPNILAGDGQLVIIPMVAAVSATEGDFVTADISGNITAFKAVTNGDLTITVNGTAVNLSKLDFSSVSTLADIATVFQNSLTDVEVLSSATALTFKSKKVGSNSTIALSAYSGGGTDLTGATLLDSLAGTATGGANSSGETIDECIVRTSGAVQYFGIITNLNLEDTAITAAAAAVQALDNIFLHHCSSLGQDIAGLATTISSATDTKTRILAYGVNQTEANLFKAAYAGRAFSTNFSGSNTAGTMNLQPLSTITPDPFMTQTIYNAAETAGADLYVSIAGVSSVVSTGGNDYFDNIYMNAALKFDLETAGFDFLRETITKVPQTEQGMNGLKAAYAKVMDQYVTNGSVAAGQWNSSLTFGNQATFLNNISQNGYYIYSLPITYQTQADRTARKAPLVQIAVKRAGAIQSSDVLVIVED
jgi:hypothetical protein